MQINYAPDASRSPTSEARRAQIVRAAVETIAEVGYDRASFARITEKAGLSSPRMISYHFDDKDDLMRQVVTDVVEAGARFMLDRIAVADSSLEQLRAYLETNLRFLRDHPREMLALTEIGPHLRTPGGEPHTSASHQEPSVQGLQALLERGQRSGEFRAFDPRTMAILVRGAIEAAVPRLRDDRTDLDAYTREVVRTFTLAVTADPRSTNRDGAR